MDAALTALRDAQTLEEVTAVLERAAPFSEDPEVGVEIIVAKEKLERLQRHTRLVRALLGSPLPPERQSSHDQRAAMLTEARLNRALGMDTTAVDRKMKDHCYGERPGAARPFCRDCNESPAYQSLCLNYLLECLRVRMATRLHYDQQNGYAIDPSVTQFMTRYTHDPLRTFLNETAALYGLPDRLDHQHQAVVAPTNDGTKPKRTEALLYKSHADSIRTVVASIARCDQASPA